MFAPVLRNRNFSIYLVGSTFSLHGLWIQRVAIGWLAWELTESETWLGIIALSEFLPIMLFGPLFGVLADRLHRKTIAFAANVLNGMLALLLFVLVLLQIIDIYLLFAITMCLGIVSSAFQPVRMSLIPSLVPEKLLAPAVAAQSIVFNVSRFLGPAIAGLAIATAGLAWAFAINAVTYLAMLLALLLVKLRRARSGGEKSHFFAELKDGIDYTYRHADIRQQLIIVALSALFGRAVIVMLPAFAGSVFGGGSSTLATLTSVSGAGAVVAGFYLTVIGSGNRLLWSTVGGTVVTGVLMTLLGATTNYALGNRPRGHPRFLADARGRGLPGTDTDHRCRDHAWPRAEPLGRGGLLRAGDRQRDHRLHRGPAWVGHHRGDRGHRLHPAVAGAGVERVAVAVRACVGSKRSCGSLQPGYGWSRGSVP